MVSIVFEYIFQTSILKLIRQHQKYCMCTLKARLFIFSDTSKSSLETLLGSENTRKIIWKTAIQIGVPTICFCVSFTEFSRKATKSCFTFVGIVPLTKEIKTYQ